MNKSNVLVHDIEVFPNCFFDVMSHLDSDITYLYCLHSELTNETIKKILKNSKYIVLGNIKEYLDLLCNQELVIGYNSWEYDECVISWIYSNMRSYSDKKLFLNAIYNISGQIIKTDGHKLKSKIPYRSWDIMRVGNLKAIFKSLKVAASNLRWPILQEFNEYFLKDLPKDKLKDGIDYCFNDVSITKRAVLGIPEEECNNITPSAARYGIWPAIELRDDLGKEYGVNIINETDSGMGNKLNNELYSKYSDLSIKAFKDLRTGYEELKYSDIIFEYVQFIDKDLQKFLQELKEIKIDVKSISGEALYEIETDKFRGFVKKNLTFNEIFCELPVTFGVGGLHSNQRSQIFSEDGEFFLKDVDAQSFYPNILIKHNVYPKHLGNQFLDYYNSIVQERVIAKENGNKLKASAMKILVNAVFGKLNYPKYWLCDLNALLSVTINGQLSLLMLIDQLYQKGIKTFYANTDGITCYVPKNNVELFQQTYHKWEKQTQFDLEETDYSKMFHQDCNNYIVITTSGKVKAKGRYDWRSYAERYGSFHIAGSFKQPIVPYAVEKYFIDHIPVEETIKNHKNILDFCICGKIGKQFTPILKDTLTGKEDVQQRALRYYIANSYKKLYKRKFEKKPIEEYLIDLNLKQNDEYTCYRDHDATVGYNIELLNDYDSSKDFEEYDVNYNYYIAECNKLIKDIMPSEEKHKQLSLFEL